MTCDVCWRSLGFPREHKDGRCVVRESFWCSQCSCYGHTASDCDEVNHVERPRYLEDLIPADVRARWDIDTATPILYHAPANRPMTLKEKEREIANTNTVEIHAPKNMLDRVLRDFMRKNKIDTVHKKEDNLRLLSEWAVSQGKKVRIIQEK